MGKRQYALVAAALALGLVACGSDGATSTARSRRGQGGVGPTLVDGAVVDGATTSTIVSDVGTTSSSVSGGPPTAVRTPAQSSAARSTTPVAPPPGAAPTTAVPQLAYRPTAPGTYRYDTSGNLKYLFTNKSYPSVTTLAADAPNGSRQHTRRQLANGGDGFVIDQINEYGNAGIALVEQRLTTTIAGSSGTKTLRPVGSGLWLPADARPGTHREFDLAGDLKGHQVVDVLRTERLTIGDEAVDALVVRTVLTFTGSASGTITSEQWLVPRSALVAKERLVGDVKVSIVKVTTSYNATLQRLKP